MRTDVPFDPKVTFRPSHEGTMKGLVEVWCRRRGTVSADLFLRATGILALLAIGALLVWPAAGPVIGFFFVTVLLNGPLSPLLPAAYEPVLMVAGRVYAPLLIALVGIVGILAIECLNFHLYRLAILHPQAATVRQSRLVGKTLALFERRPFFTIWLCAWSPLPLWAVRILAPIAQYPMHRYLLALFLGRLPRLWFFAALGPVVPVSTPLLVIATATMVVVALGIVTHRALARKAPVPVASAG